MSLISLCAGQEESKTMNKTKTATADNKPFDPLKSIAPRDIRDMATNVYLLGQNVAYWNSVPVPVRPDGYLPAEPLLQAGALLVPVAMYVYASLHSGFLGALWGLPLYYGVFYFLDWLMDKAIARKCAKERNRDLGRYAFTRILGDRLGLKPEQVTLDVLLKMVCDFALSAVYGRQMPEERKAAVMRKAYGYTDLTARLEYLLDVYDATMQFAPPATKVTGNGERGNGGAATVARGGAAAAAPVVYYQDPAPAPVLYGVNYATGLPMSDSQFDVMGNVYGHGEPGGFPQEMSY